MDEHVVRNSMSYLEAEKTAFCIPKGAGVSLARMTTLQACGPDMREERARRYSVLPSRLEM